MIMVVVAILMVFVVVADMGAEVGMGMVVTIGMAMMVTSSIIVLRKTASSGRS